MSKFDEMRLPQSSTADESARLAAVAARFERQYRHRPVTLPEEVQAMPIYEQWAGGLLEGKLASPFWDLAPPKKNQRCLDLGCGASFLIYPWRDWQAYFYGQDLSVAAVEMLKSRGPQLNSKLFKGTVLAPAHQLNYEANFFDVAIATGWSCYYPPSYWQTVMEAVKKVLKPEGIFVFDFLNPEQPLSEDWAVLETYLGAEVFLEPLAAWEKVIAACEGKILKRKSGELFELYRVKF